MARGLHGRAVALALALAFPAAAHPPCPSGEVCATDGWTCITAERAGKLRARVEAERERCEADTVLLRQEHAVEIGAVEAEAASRLALERAATDEALRALRDRDAGHSGWAVIGWTAGGLVVGAVVGAVAVWAAQ